MPNKEEPRGADIKYARECLSSLAICCGACNMFLLPDGEPAFFTDANGETPAQARKRDKCMEVHHTAGQSSRRFGGRYIYSCGNGLMFIACPVTADGHYAGAIISGPFCASDADEPVSCFGGCGETAVRSASYIGAVSRLQFLVACQISDYGNGDVLADEDENRRQSEIAEYMQRMKTESPNTPSYPLHIEDELLQAIRAGNKKYSSRLLNEILGFIFFSSASGTDISTVRARVIELLVLLSRAAAHGGVDIEFMLTMNRRYLNEIETLRSIDDMASWLSRSMNDYTSLIFSLSKVKHADVIYRATEFIRRNYTSRLTLDNVAESVYLSPSYFSKIFKEEMGCSFVQYLNGLRIERSKYLLLSTETDIIDICGMAGFEDQSYFTRVFRQITGMTPGKYREFRGRRRLDTSNEKG